MFVPDTVQGCIAAGAFRVPLSAVDDAYGDVACVPIMKYAPIQEIRRTTMKPVIALVMFGFLMKDGQICLIGVARTMKFFRSTLLHKV